MAKLLSIALRPAKRQPMVECQQVKVSVDAGLSGDYWSGHIAEKRQVTLLSREAWAAAIDEVGASLHWTKRRANLLVEGVNLEETAGRQIRVGACIFEVTEETKPCQLMEDTHPGLFEALRPEWRGGVRVKVLHGGTLNVDDEVTFVD